jgi:hypothetical protein
MIAGRCVDYVVSFDEADPIRVVEETFDDRAAALAWLENWRLEFQRVDLGRHVIITEADGTVIEEIEMPPCNDEDDDPDNDDNS